MEIKTILYPIVKKLILEESKKYTINMMTNVIKCQIKTEEIDAIKSKKRRMKVRVAERNLCRDNTKETSSKNY